MKVPKNDLILMAEDDGDDRLLVRDALAECGVNDKVRFVADGEELMDYLLRRGQYANGTDAPRPGLILMDLNMPRKDGREALREIRAHPEISRVPVVVFTTSSADVDVAKMYDLGANSFVAKPAAFDDLVNTIRGVVRYWFGIVELPSPKSAAL